MKSIKRFVDRRAPLIVRDAEMRKHFEFLFFSLHLMSYLKKSNETEQIIVNQLHKYRE